MKSMKDYEKSYQTESDVDALTRAQQVQADPKRHEAAKQHAATKLKETDEKRQQLASIAAKKTPAKKPTGAAHNSVMHKKVKDGLKKAFPNY